MLTPIEELKDDIVSKPTTLDIVSSLLDDENVEMKTEIVNPYALTTLMTLAHYLKEHNDEASYKILVYWKDVLLKYMVSNKRMSRQEITEILKGYFALERQKEKQLSLTSNLAKLQKDDF